MQDGTTELLPDGSPDEAFDLAGAADDVVRERVGALLAAARGLSDACADLADALRPLPGNGMDDPLTMDFARLRAERTAALLDEAAAAAHGTLGLLGSAYGALDAPEDGPRPETPEIDSRLATPSPDDPGAARGVSPAASSASWPLTAQVPSTVPPPRSATWPDAFVEPPSRTVETGQPYGSGEQAESAPDGVPAPPPPPPAPEGPAAAIAAFPLDPPEEMSDGNQLVYADEPAGDDQPTWADEPAGDDQPAYDSVPTDDDQPAIGRSGFDDEPVQDYRGERVYGDAPAYQPAQAYDDGPRYDVGPGYGDRTAYQDRAASNPELGYGDLPYDGLPGYADRSGYGADAGFALPDLTPGLPEAPDLPPSPDHPAFRPESARTRAETHGFGRPELPGGDDAGVAVLARQVEAARRHLQAAVVVAHTEAGHAPLNGVLGAVERVLAAITELAQQARETLRPDLADRTFPGEARFLCAVPWERTQLVGADPLDNEPATPSGLARLLTSLGYEAWAVTSDSAAADVQLRTGRYAAHVALVEPAGGGRQRWSAALEWTDLRGTSRTWAETLGPVELDEEELARRVDELLRRCVGPLR